MLTAGGMLVLWGGGVLGQYWDDGGFKICPFGNPGYCAIL